MLRFEVSIGVRVRDKVMDRVFKPHLVQVLAAGGVQGMLEHLDLLDDRQVVVVRRHAHHEAVLHVERDLAPLAVLPDQRVQRVRVGHPPDEPAVGRQRDDRIPVVRQSL